MDRLHVIAVVCLLCKTLATVWAGVGSLASPRALGPSTSTRTPAATVAQLVRLQLPGPGEALATGAAGEGPLAGVQPLVRPQVVGLGEALGAVGAGVGLAARVDELVALEVARLAEALAALRAGVGPLAAVDALVRLEVAQCAEALATLCAGEGLFALHVPWLPGALGHRGGTGPRGGQLQLHLPVLAELRLIKGPGPEAKWAVKQHSVRSQLVQLTAQLSHVDGLKAVGLRKVLLLRGAGIVAVEVRVMVLQLDIVQGVGHLRAQKWCISSIRLSRAYCQ